jgi:DNA ligase-associated metallophosphoesterase
MSLTPLTIGTAGFMADPSGTLWWPAERTLFVADLHLEKGTSFARRGIMLPPWDTAATLERLEAVMARLEPVRVVALGDSFHDTEGEARLDPADRQRLDRMTGSCEWVWLAGNHDPAMGEHDRFERHGIVFRHSAILAGKPEVSGHFHPKATIRVHGLAVSRRCFVTDGMRLIMPAFGTYTGGLDVRTPVIADLFPQGFTAYLAGSNRITAVPSAMLGVAPLPLAV